MSGFSLRAAMEIESGSCESARNPTYKSDAKVKEDVGFLA